MGDGIGYGVVYCTGGRIGEGFGEGEEDDYVGDGILVGFGC